MIRRLFSALLPPTAPLHDDDVESLLGDPSLVLLAQDMHQELAGNEKFGSDELGSLVVRYADMAADLRRLYGLDPEQMDLALAAAAPVWHDGEL